MFLQIYVNSGGILYKEFQEKGFYREMEVNK